MRLSATPKRIQRFLDALAEGYSPTAAAVAIGVHRATVYRLRNSSPDFRKRWDAALEQGSDVLEDEMRRRALEGTAKPVFYRGEECGSIQEYSDTLLIFALKARRPEKYRENIKIDVSYLDNAIETELAELASRSEGEVSSPAPSVERIN